MLNLPFYTSDTETSKTLPGEQVLLHMRRKEFIALHSTNSVRWKTSQAVFLSYCTHTDRLKICFAWGRIATTKLYDMTGCTGFISPQSLSTTITKKEHNIGLSVKVS